ncbi:putative late blight resistance proteinR1A-4 [Sesamum angolense]|uniref:Late blight resistance proteinR1A-4 n=1 Tax=Sesamum angolense TaxID=2727404 RepID=A0AAE1X0C2_9LAMI|nr:putative late blight resistance proteinR1A-4 [Sesamum angolense]
MDDMWDTEIWDAVRRSFPDDGNGSRVLLTTRISVVAEYANSCSSYHMRFLSEENSWNLLCRKVFGEGACPLELEEIGKEISRKCGGLPLSVVAIGGLLSKASRTQEYWRSVGNNLNAVATEVDVWCVEIFVYLRFRLLRVLDVVVIHFHEFPAEVIELVNLRYLAFTCAWQVPPSILKLQNLETLVYHKWKSQQCPLLPRDIWVMPKLRHLWVTPSCFLDHAQLLPNNSFLLENLQTLSEVRNFKCSSNIIKRIPNLRKLKISYDVSLFESWSSYQLENLITLHKLETLTLRTENSCHIPDVVHPEKLAFPLQLRKLTLSGLRLMSRNLNIIGALPNLEVLKLRRNACQGPEWRPIEGEFCQLKFLLLEGLDIVQWIADDTHFPCLQNLIIRSCCRLKEIPSCFGNIYTLELIELVDCRSTALISAKQIQRELQCLENYQLEVRLNPGLTDRG